MAPLPEELVQEILLRFSPDNPESLLRAALVCKSWRRLISSPRFNSRFREFNRKSPPVLGFFCNIFRKEHYFAELGDTNFMPLTSSFQCPPFLPCWAAVDVRHGYVLLYDKRMATPESQTELQLMVWNPITQELSRSLPMVPMSTPKDTWNAALLCDDDDVVDSGISPFRVVVVATDKGVTSACVYSSEQHVWSTPISTQYPAVRLLKGRNALVGNALYFKCNESRILEYDVSKQELSVFSRPPSCENTYAALMTAEDGGLGFAVLHGSKLSAWSRKVGLDGIGRWTEQRVFELDKLLPFSARSTCTTNAARVFAVENSFSFVFIGSRDDGLFIVDLKSGRVRKVYEPSVGVIRGIFPYASFCGAGNLPGSR